MIPIYLVDAFVGHTDPTALGNPAGVCILEVPADEAWMRRVAAEMNQAETAFLAPAGEGAFHLRWFTPTVEVPLCGHATLASAHTLFSTRRAALSVRFETKSGTLTCTQRNDGSIAMDFPANAAHEAEMPAILAPLLDGKLEWFGSGMDHFAVLKTEQDVLDFKPDFATIAAAGTRGLIITARAARPGADIVSRFFAPQSGVPEDHVTGSAHCMLATHWAPILGKSKLVGYQASPRGGWVHVEQRGDRVELAGHCRTFLKGELAV